MNPVSETGATAARRLEKCAFFFWRFRVASDDTARQRHRLVNEVVGPIYRDPAVREMVKCLYARKLTSGTPAVSLPYPHEAVDEVRLFTACASEALRALTHLVSLHLPRDVGSITPVPYPAKDRACWSDCGWYRDALTWTAGVALDLHSSAEFEIHRAFLEDIYGDGGVRALTRLALEDYFGAFSSSYRLTSRGQREEFWDRFLRYGPEPNLFPPAYLVVNLLLLD